MQDRECVALLQWALPRLQRPWAGFRKVRNLFGGINEWARQVDPSLPQY